MKSNLLLSTCLLLCSSFFNLIYSQQKAPSYSIKGIVIDSVIQRPLDYVTISLKSLDDQPVKTTLTKSDGSFSLDKLVSGKYQLAIVSVGYTTRIIPVELKDSTHIELNLGKITILNSSTSLNEVRIVADRPLIKQDVDRITYDVQADPENKINSALDMMRKVPLLSLDAEDNIKLKGQSNYKILINGKPSSMMARSPKDVLRSMPASSIQKIEVITTPPAKYDSEGLAGIINIITTKKIDNGYNGNINLSHPFPVGGPGGGVSFTVKEGKFGASGYGGMGTYNQPEMPNSSSRISAGPNPSDLSLSGKQKWENSHAYMGTEFSFEIDSLNLLTAEVSGNKGKYNSKGDQSSLLNTPQNTIGYNIFNLNKSNWNGIDLGLNYQLGFKNKKDRLLTFSYKYSTSKENWFNFLQASNRVNYNEPDYQQTNTGKASEQTLQLDYVYPFKNMTIEAGLKGILRNNKSDFQYKSLNSNNGQFEEDPDRTNKFNNNQNIIGAYNSYQYNLENWGFKAGLRLERTSINADFISNASQVNISYLNLIPSVSVNRKFKNMSNLNFGFTQRIERPGLYILNPFVNRSNPNFESTGNPDLKPVLSNDISLGYSVFKKGSINMGLSYSFANNTIQRVSVFDANSNVTRSTYLNIGKDRSLGSNFSINYPITNKWNFNISGNLNYIWIEGLINNVLATNSGINGYCYGGSGYKFEKGWRVNANFSYSSPNITLQGKSTSWYNTSLSISKDIIKNKLTFSASASNPFTKYREYVSETKGADFTQISNSLSYFRRYNVSINYRFGKLKESIKKNQRGINNDDVKGKSSGGQQ